MNYKINWDAGSGGVFAVPDAAVEGGLKLASGKAAKVLLYFMKYRALPPSPEDIGVTAEDIEDALSYWEQIGVLMKTDAPAAEPARKSERKEQVKIIAPVPAAAAPAKKEPVIKPQKSLLPAEIAERIAQSEEVAFLFKSAEGTLSRVLTFDDQRTILWFYDHLGMSADVILMLIGHCCTIGRTSMAKIEKTALAWHDKNIVTHEQAENEILSMQKAFTFESQVQNRLRLQSKLTESQKKYIDAWSEMDLTLDMVELAYDKTVDGIGKSSFSYMNKILTKWHDNGITDAAAARDFDERTKPSPKASGTADNKKTQSGAPSYDLDLLFAHAMSSTPTVKKKKGAE